jgi:hypothetical protein
MSYSSTLCANISEIFSPCQIEVGRGGDLGYFQPGTKGQTHFYLTFLIKSLGGGSGEAFVPCGA